MKCIITGHSRGIGRYLYEHFTNLGWDVVGMSRANGYDITNDRQRVIDESIGCDLFINNASNSDSQTQLLKALCLKVPKMIILGSSITDFVNKNSLDYIIIKKKLEDTCRLISMNNDPLLAKMLMIKLAFAEPTYSLQKPDRINSDHTIPYKEIANAIDFWLLHTSIRQIEFEMKLTDYVVEEIRKFENFLKVESEIDKFVENINGLVNV
jgi:hypothetical protein